MAFAFRSEEKQPIITLTPMAENTLAQPSPNFQPPSTRPSRQSAEQLLGQAKKVVSEIAEKSKPKPNLQVRLSSFFDQYSEELARINLSSAVHRSSINSKLTLMGQAPISSSSFDWPTTSADFRRHLSALPNDAARASYVVDLTMRAAALEPVLRTGRADDYLSSPLQTPRTPPPGPVTSINAGTLTPPIILNDSPDDVRRNIGLWLTGTSIGAENILHTLIHDAQAPLSDGQQKDLLSIQSRAEALEKRLHSSASRPLSFELFNDFRALREDFQSLASQISEDQYWANAGVQMFGVVLPPALAEPYKFAMRYNSQLQGDIATTVTIGGLVYPPAEALGQGMFALMGFNGIAHGLKDSDAGEIILGGAMLIPFAARYVQSATDEGSLAFRAAGAASRASGAYFTSSMSLSTYKTLEKASRTYLSFSDVMEVGSNLFMMTGYSMASGMLKGVKIRKVAEPIQEPSAIPIQPIIEPIPAIKSTIFEPSEIESNSSHASTPAPVSVPSESGPEIYASQMKEQAINAVCKALAQSYQNGMGQNWTSFIDLYDLPNRSRSTRPVSQKYAEQICRAALGQYGREIIERLQTENGITLAQLSQFKGTKSIVKYLPTKIDAASSSTGAMLGQMPAEPSITPTLKPVQPRDIPISISTEAPVQTFSKLVRERTAAAQAYGADSPEVKTIEKRMEDARNKIEQQFQPALAKTWEPLTAPNSQFKEGEPVMLATPESAESLYPVWVRAFHDIRNPITGAASSVDLLRHTLQSTPDDPMLGECTAWRTTADRFLLNFSSLTPDILSNPKAASELVGQMDHDLADLSNSGRAIAAYISTHSNSTDPNLVFLASKIDQFNQAQVRTATLYGQLKSAYSLPVATSPSPVYSQIKNPGDPITGKSRPDTPLIRRLSQISVKIGDDRQSAEAEVYEQAGDAATETGDYHMAVKFYKRAQSSDALQVIFGHPSNPELQAKRLNLQAKISMSNQYIDISDGKVKPVSYADPMPPIASKVQKGSTDQIEGRRAWKIGKAAFSPDYFGPNMADIYAKTKTVTSKPIRFINDLDFEIEGRSDGTLGIKSSLLHDGQYFHGTDIINLSIDMAPSENLGTIIHELHHRYSDQAEIKDMPLWLDEGFTELLSHDLALQVSKRLVDAGDTRFEPLPNAPDHYPEEVTVARSVERLLIESLIEKDQLQTPQQAADRAREMIKEAYFRDDFSAVRTAIESKFGANSSIKIFNAGYAEGALWAIYLDPTGPIAGANPPATMFDQFTLSDYRVLGRLYRKRGQNKQAISSYNAAIRLSPDAWYLYRELGNIYSGQGDNFAARGNPKDAQQKYEQAISNYQICIRLNPSYAPTYLSLGGLLEKSGKQTEALAYLDKYTQLTGKPAIQTPQILTNPNKALAASLNDLISNLDMELNKNPKTNAKKKPKKKAKTKASASKKPVKTDADESNSSVRPGVEPVQEPTNATSPGLRPSATLQMATPISLAVDAAKAVHKSIQKAKANKAAKKAAQALDVSASEPATLTPVQPRVRPVTAPGPASAERYLSDQAPRFEPLGLQIQAASKDGRLAASITLAEEGEPFTTLAPERLPLLQDQLQDYLAAYPDVRASDKTILKSLENIDVDFRDWETSHSGMDLADYFTSLNRIGIPHELLDQLNGIEGALTDHGLNYDLTPGRLAVRLVGTNTVYSLPTTDGSYLALAKFAQTASDGSDDELFAYQFRTAMGVPTAWVERVSPDMLVEQMLPGMDVVNFRMLEEVPPQGPDHTSLLWTDVEPVGRYYSRYRQQIGLRAAEDVFFSGFDNAARNYVVDADCHITRIDHEGFGYRPPRGLEHICNEFGLDPPEEMPPNELALIETAFKARWDELVAAKKQNSAQLLGICRQHSNAEDQANHQYHDRFYAQSAERMLGEFGEFESADAAWQFFLTQTQSR